MLADDAVSTLKRAIVSPSSEETREANRSVTDAIGRAQRFVLSPLTVETAEQLADRKAIERTRDHLHTPARLTWLEWAGSTPGCYAASQRHALLLIGSDQMGAQTIMGWGGYFFDTPQDGSRGTVTPIFFKYDFPGDGDLFDWIYAPLEMLDTQAGRQMRFDSLSRVDNRGLACFAAAALAIINTPRLSHVLPHDLSAINKARRRLNRPALLEWREVRIQVDKGALGRGDKIIPTEGRALHHVRTFLRLKRGKVELVRPHWRGNPRFGVIMHRYVAFRAEDETGEWKGGPLPAPELIKDLT